MKPYSTHMNFKALVRIRPLDYNPKQEMIEVPTTSTVTIKDFNKKTANDRQTFSFTTAFPSNATQEMVYDYVRDTCLEKFIDGTNACILSYGQTTAGKSYTLFGEDPRMVPTASETSNSKQKDRRGVIPRMFQQMLAKADELRESRDTIFNCAFFEIYLDKVRDLTRNFRNKGESKIKMPKGGGTMEAIDLKGSQISTTYETENLEIYENSNGEILIKGLRIHQLKTVEDLYEMLFSGFSLRSKNDPDKSLSIRSHTIFQIQQVQRDKVNENLILHSSTIQFCDLAGSERIGQLNEGTHFQEAIMINSCFNTLSKLLNSVASATTKPMLYRENKLTRALQNTLTPTSMVLFFSHLNPSDSNFEECLSTLQFAERSKNVDLRNKGGENMLAGDPSMMAYANAEKMYKKMNDDHSELKKQYEQLQKEHRRKFEDLKMVLGLEFDIEKKISDPNAKEWQEYRRLRDAYAKNENLRVRLEDLQEKHEVLTENIHKLQHQGEEKQNKYADEIKKLGYFSKRVEEEKHQASAKVDEISKESTKARNEEVKRRVMEGRSTVEERSNLLLNLPQLIQTQTDMHSRVEDIKVNLAYDAESKFVQNLEQFRLKNSESIQGTRKKFEDEMKAKVDELHRIMQEIEDFKRDEKESRTAQENELITMHEMASYLHHYIERAETGENGGRPVRIPLKDKTIPPSRTKHPRLYKIYERRKYLTSTKEFSSYFTQTEKAATMRRNYSHTTRAGFPDSRTELQSQPSLQTFQATTPVQKGVEDMSKTKSVTKFLIRDIATPNKMREELKSRELKSRMQKFPTERGGASTVELAPVLSPKATLANEEYDLSVNVFKLTVLADVKQYDKKMQNHLKRCEDRIAGLEKKLAKFENVHTREGGDLSSLLKQRELYKQKYYTEVNKSKAEQVTFETQRRMLESAGSNAGGGSELLKLGTSSKFIMTRPTTTRDETRPTTSHINVRIHH